jgi:pyocin large subunit-like protein
MGTQVILEKKLNISFIFPPEFILNCKFSSEEKLTDHFKKHRREFNFESETEYLRSAQAFISTMGNENVLLKIRDDGEIVLYNPFTNEFAVLTWYGIIRTYFKPDPKIHKKPTNLDYFYRP